MKRNYVCVLYRHSLFPVLHRVVLLLCRKRINLFKLSSSTNIDSAMYSFIFNVPGTYNGVTINFTYCVNVLHRSLTIHYS